MQRDLFERVKSLLFNQKQLFYFFHQNHQTPPKNSNFNIVNINIILTRQKQNRNNQKCLGSTYF